MIKPHKVVTYNISLELLESLNELSKALDLNKSQVIEKALQNLHTQKEVEIAIQKYKDSIAKLQS